MMIEMIHRPARATRPVEHQPEEMIAAPPTSAGRSTNSLRVQAFLPVVGALTSVVSIVVFRNGNRVFLILGALLLVAALVAGVAMALSHSGSAARQRRAQRENYLDYLERLRAGLRARAHELRTESLRLDPAPAALGELIRDPARIWERRRRDSDFLRVRIGLGDERMLPLTVPPEQDPVQPYDPIMLGEARAVVRQCSTVRGVSVTVALDGAGDVAIIGPRDDVLAAARSLAAQIAALHAPDDVLLAATFPDQAGDDWHGLDLLPHILDPARFDGPLPVRRVAPTVGDLVALLDRELDDRARHAATERRTAAFDRSPGRAAGRPRLVVFADDWGRRASTLLGPDAGLTPADLGVTVVHLLRDRLDEPADVTLRITVDDGHAIVADTRHRPEPGRVLLDRTSTTSLEALARRMAGHRMRRTAAEAAEAGEPVTVEQLLGIEDIRAVTPDAAWPVRCPRDFLRVPIGLDDAGAPVLLDLKESAQLGMGPHGICIGATGSGKSELLRTLITSLALTHPPEDLAIVLVDYKGGAAFTPFAGLPHVAGVIDNLADDPQLTERARASINGEIVRRQHLLKQAGSVASIGHYREKRRIRPDLPPLPHLLIVIDEFGELLTAEPEFVDLLITIGRIGRSIGVHLLLSSQRLEAGKLKGLDTYLSYRIGLRTFSPSESAMILDTPDAFHLPSVPGYGYLKVDTTTYQRFRSGFVSGPLESAEHPGAGADPGAEPVLLPRYPCLAGSTAAEPVEPNLETPMVGRSLLDECVARLSAPERAVRPVWLSPLPARLSLGTVLAEHGAAGRSTPRSIPIGLLDDPAHQTQTPWLLDLTRSGGHVAVVGAPQSGLTTFLRTLAVSVALAHTPRQISCYGLDLTGGGLSRIEGFPHVGGVATRSQPERLTRLLDELLGMLELRERVFRDHAIDSVGMLRREHAAGRVPELAVADIVLLIDGFGQLRSEFESLDPAVADLLQRGSSFGIHVIAAMTRWNDLRMAQQPLVGTRVELHLNDAVDSGIDRKLAATIPAGQPGRALTDGKLLAHIALPTVEDCDDQTDGEAIEVLARQVTAGWSGARAAPIRVLPTDLAPDQLPAADPGDPHHVTIGLRQDTMAAARLHLGTLDQHLIVFGDHQAGKSTLLRGVVRGLSERLGPDDLVFAVMDIRGTVAPAVPEEHLGGHARTPVGARRLAESVAGELARRAAEPAATRSGPRIVVVADDYDMLVSGGSEPLAPLLPYLASARDLHLHVLLTRPVAGSTRAMYDASLQSVRDTGGSCLLMSGERNEGPILPRLYAERMPPGRGWFVRRGEPPHVMQVAHFRGGDRTCESLAPDRTNDS